MNEELLFTILFFGFRRFRLSLWFAAINRGFPSPKAGILLCAFPFMECCRSTSLPLSPEVRVSFSLSLMLYVFQFDRMLVEVLSLYNCGTDFRGLRAANDSLTPAVAGAGVVANGFVLVIGASEG